VINADDLPQLPKGWFWTTLGDVRLDNGRAIVPAKTPDQLFELYSVPRFEEREPEIVSGKEVGSSKQIVEKETVLLCKINPRINRVWIVGDFSPHPKIASTEWIPFFRQEGIEPEYLCYFMRNDSFKTYLASNASGVGGSLMRIRPATFLAYPFPLAPKNEQCRIVGRVEELFSYLDAGVESLLKVKTLLKHYRQAVLKYAFEGKLTEEWRKTHKDQIDTIKNPLGKTERESKVRRDVPEKVEIPEDLQQTSMPQSWSFFSVADLLRNGAFIDVKDGNHGTNHPKAGDFTSDGLPFITASQVIDFEIDYENAPKLKGRPLEKLKVGFSHPGDVVLSHKGTVGRVGICKQECVLSPQTTYYRTSADLIDRSFLAYFFASPLFQSQLAAVKSQTTRDFVSISKQYALFVVVPSILEQKEIVAEIDNRLPITRHIERIIDENLLGSQRLRRSILGSAFEGALVPQDPSDEPAENLLERIKAERAKSKGEKDTNKRRKNKPNQLELSSYVK